MNTSDITLDLKQFDGRWVAKEDFQLFLQKQLKREVTLNSANYLLFDLCQSGVKEHIVKLLIKGEFLPKSTEVSISNAEFINKDICFKSNVRRIEVLNPEHLVAKKQISVTDINGEKTKAWVSVNYQMKVPKLIVNLELGQEISDNDVVWLSSNVQNPDAYFHHQLPRRLISNKKLAVDSVISTHNTKIRPVISNGDRVLIVYSNRGVRIESKGIALASGNIGDRIIVQPENAEKSVLVEVVNEGVVGV